jgi:hypothetical protein
MFDIQKYKTKKEPVFFIVSFVCVLITQIIITRYNIEESYMNGDSFLFFDILFKKPMSSGDLIY